MTAQIVNPVLPGFHPDPSIVRVGADYYIATSTFEWWPGVRIHHSTDLVHWQHHSYAITRKSQLDLTGHPDSTGVWAPCLSHAHGQFWLIYTDVRSMVGAYKDTHNYLVTAPSIEGPWSEPVYLNSSGFDPSLFHDTAEEGGDGRSWFLNQQWIHHPDKHAFNGILLQAFDRSSGKLVGPIKNIFKGTALGVVEGPHLYRRKGWYYLLTAEGGTSYEHAATVARSRNIDGPYEVMPGNPLLTAHHSPSSGLQRAGHASWVQTPQAEWYMAHLCGRPLEWTGPNAESATKPSRYASLHCNLGRETALQKLSWRDDDWPTLASGGSMPATVVAAPVASMAAAPTSPTAPSTYDGFDSPALSPHFNSLRLPVDESWLSLTERPGHLRLRGRESLMSLFQQSLLARRQQHHRCRAETTLDFAPTGFHQMAGIAAYYNTSNHAYLHVSADTDADADNAERVLRLIINRDGVLTEPTPLVVLPSTGAVRLALQFDHDQFHFEWALAGGAWQPIGHAMDSAFLSDEFACRARDGYATSFGFTGSFIALACQDLGGTRLHADFDDFSYTFSG